MSLYIVARQFGAIPKLLRLRSFATSVGLDDRGALALSGIKQQLFTVFRSGDGFSIKADSEGVRLGNRELRRGELSPLPAGAELKVLDFSMQARAGSTSSESLAAANVAGPPTLAGSARLKLAGLTQGFPIFHGAFSAGSSDEDSIFLPFDGISARHLALVTTPSGIEIGPCAGSVKIEGVPAPMGYVITGFCAVRLEPLGITLEINFLPHRPFDPGWIGAGFSTTMG